MKILTCEVTNFGSYKHLAFTFNELGLTLIHGSTGSGKSTLFDVPCWILFGITAKNGSVDEVRSWINNNVPTTGTAKISLVNSEIQITRIRGRPSENDLYWIENNKKIRGKDIKETQLLLEKRLNCTSDLYLASCYISEFSSVSSFFIQAPKMRRQLFDIIADTSLADKLADAIIIEKKKIKPIILQLDKDILLCNRDEQNANIYLKDLNEQAELWDKNQQDTINLYKEKDKSFETDKILKITNLTTKLKIWDKDIEEQKSILTQKYIESHKKLEQYSTQHNIICSTCNRSTVDEILLDSLSNNFNNLNYQLSQISKSINPFKSELNMLQISKSNYCDEIEQLKLDINPFRKKSILQNDKINTITKILCDKKQQYQTVIDRNLSLETLQILTTDLRGYLIQKAINDIQTKTLEYLESFFDSELRVSLSVPDNDSIEVEITKNGYLCTYSQLSKGQRGLLRLCFSLSVMKVAANKAGIHFNTVMLDEALDGLDSDLKVKAFSLLTHINLEHSSTLVIDHSTEFKNLFPTQYNVIISSDESTISEQ